jgi:hypothetical protein
MKYFTSILGLLFLTSQANAQIPQVPSGTPGQPQLPTPELKPLQPADLTVSGITFVSIVHNTDTKTYLVKVIVATRNTGELKSVKTRLQAFTKTPSGAGSWTVMGEAGNVNAIDPGRTYSAVYSFKGSSLTIGGVPFDFRVRTDSGNFVTESDEINNYSSAIIINPRRH